MHILKQMQAAFYQSESDQPHPGRARAIIKAPGGPAIDGAQSVDGAHCRFNRSHANGDRVWNGKEPVIR